MIDALLDLARLGSAALHKERVDMRALVQGEIDALPASVKQQVTFFVGELPECTADPILVRQVWSNLLSNAAKFSAKASAPRVEVGSRGAEHECTYFVRDNGIGFDASAEKRLFSVLHRIHPGAEFEGTGIGLAIVHKIVSRHGGNVWAESQPGAGATFCFTLPGGRE